MGMVETHGTATALGDPIEVGSLSAAVLSRRSAVAAMAVGGIKANGGHAEPAAGMTGLVKLALGLRASEAAPNAQLQRLNPHLGGALRGIVGSAFPIQAGGLPANEEAMAGGVSSFGYSGTICHAVLRHEVAEAASWLTVLTTPTGRSRVASLHPSSHPSGLPPSVNKHSTETSTANADVWGMCKMR